MSAPPPEPSWSPPPPRYDMRQGWSAPPGWQLVPVRPPTSGLAIAALVFGLLWLGGAGSAVAVICGHAAMRNIRERGERGFALAAAGLWLGYGGLIITVGLAITGGR